MSTLPSPVGRRRWIYGCLAGLLFAALPSSGAFAESPPPSGGVTRMLFGSCIKEELPIPILRTMFAEQPELIVFLGDNIYADTADMAVMRQKYARLAANGDFARLRSSIPVLATWDDHDYGINDGGADFPQRSEAQKEFLDFWQVPADSPRRTQAGVYHAHTLGSEGQRVQIILLDTRYFRSPLKTAEKRIGGPYVADEDPSKTMLGETQWRWLEQQLRQPAEVRVIATSIQCLAEAAGQETWSNLPHQRSRLFQLIQDTAANGVILISGDRHWSELSVVKDQVPYPLYELTSSSFNQVHARGTPTENRYRASDRTFHRENYGLIEVDWERPAPSVTLQIRDLDGQVQIERQIPLAELQP